MTLMPDTNVWIDVLRSTKITDAVLRLAQMSNGHPLALSSLSRFEIEAGIVGRKNTLSTRAALDAVLAGPVVLCDFDHQAAILAAVLAANARAAGRQLSTVDALIADHAQALGLALVTAEKRLIEALPGMTVIDWLA